MDRDLISLAYIKNPVLERSELSLLALGNLPLLKISVMFLVIQ